MAKGKTHRHLFLDVGGTSARMWIKNEKGRLLKRVSLPPSSFLQKIQNPKIPFSSATIGLRGVWTPYEKGYLKRQLKRTAHAVRILSDVEFAHEQSFGTRAGLVLNAGTGSIAFGRNQKGKTDRAGGYGPLVGDEGSGFWIGREYLKRVLLKKKKPVPRSYLSGPEAIRKIAHLSFTVLRLAQQKKDREAVRIVQEAQGHLCRLIQELTQKLQWKGTIPLVLAGGLFRNAYFRKGFLTLLKRETTVTFLHV